MPAADKANGVSVRVSGTFAVPEAGDYGCAFTAIGQARMYLDGTLIAERWEGRSRGAKRVRRTCSTWWPTSRTRSSSSTRSRRARPW
ncbi:MAG: PA14 domain-containing protein [Anaerolineae bacterium]